MNPSDVHARDWSLYYNGTYMLHAEKGVVNVRVSDAGLQYKKHNSPWKKVSPEMLSCLWPQARSINVYNQGVHVGRSPRREARRSATLGHYFLQWSGEGLCMDGVIMRELCFPKEYPSLEYALKALREEEFPSIAISPDLILQGNGTKVQMICSGFEAGFAEVRDDRLLPVPDEYPSPTLKRAIFKLEKGGYIWQS
jgi:hypothetical protein